VWGSCRAEIRNVIIKEIATTTGTFRYRLEREKEEIRLSRYANGRGGGPPRNHVIPNEPPYTAYIGNAPETMVQGDFEKHLFVGLKVKQVRLVRDRQTDRFRGR